MNDQPPRKSNGARPTPRSAAAQQDSGGGAHRGARHIAGRACGHIGGIARPGRDGRARGRREQGCLAAIRGDFANYRRRTDQQREDELGLANESLLLKLLAIVDDFDRAVAHVPHDCMTSPWVEASPPSIGNWTPCSNRKRHSDQGGGPAVRSAVGEAVLHEPTTSVRTAS